MKECIDLTGILNRNSVFLPCSRKKTKKIFLKPTWQKNIINQSSLLLLIDFSPNLKRLKDEKYISMS